MPRPALASIAAIVSVLAASGCCLPILPFLAAAGLAGGSAFLWAARPYLLAASICFIGFGFFQAARARKCDRGASLSAGVFLWISTAAVLISTFFPQLVYLGGGNRVPDGQ